MGETYDARKEMPGWATASFDDSKWENAILAKDNGSIIEPFSDAFVKEKREFGFVRPPVMQAYPAQPVRITQELPAKSVKQIKPGTWIFDLGQNFAGNRPLQGESRSREKIRAALRRDAPPRWTHHDRKPARSARDRHLHRQRISRGRNMVAAIHLPWIPICRSHGLRPRTAARHRHRPGAAFRHRPNIRLRVLRSGGQPGLPKRRLDPARELDRAAHRLPAARRAPRLDGRRPDLRRIGRHPRRRGGLLPQVAARAGGSRHQGRLSIRPTPPILSATAGPSTAPHGPMPA